MPLSRREFTRAERQRGEGAVKFTCGVGLVLVLAGCAPMQSPKDEPEDHRSSNAIYRNFTGSDLYATIPSDLITIKDEDVDFNGQSSDPELIARWATERKKVIGWCLGEKITEINENNAEQVVYKRVWPKGDMRPQTRFDQAIAIGSKVVESVPSNSWERYRLGESLFYKGSAQYWGIDACMNRIGVLKARMGLSSSSPEKDEKNPAFPDESKEIENLRFTARILYDDMRVYQTAALRHFTVYGKDRPMDKTVLDFMWKIHYQLGDFREAVRLMNDVLDAGIITEDNAAKYVSIRKAINDYLVEREINAAAPKPDQRVDWKVGQEKSP
jgi:hypothetical protein